MLLRLKVWAVVLPAEIVSLLNLLDTLSLYICSTQYLFNKLELMSLLSALSNSRYDFVRRIKIRGERVREQSYFLGGLGTQRGSNQKDLPFRVLLIGPMKYRQRGLSDEG